jgi:hypothetical protein
MPPSFVDDGCSNVPDRFLIILARLRLARLYDLRPLCRIHDWRYCTRAQPQGSMSADAQRDADAQLREFMREYLPRLLDFTAGVYFRGLLVGGPYAFDSCGPHPRGCTAGQLAQGLCRHALPRPAWMPLPAPTRAPGPSA